MRLCFSTLGCSERRLDEIIELSVQYGINALELRGIGGVLNNSDIRDFNEVNIEKTKALLHTNGIAPIVLGTSCSFHNAEKSKSTYEQAKNAIDIAEKMEIPYIRVFGNKELPDRAAAIRNVTAGISRVVQYAAEHHVAVLLEVHGDFNRTESLEPVVRALGENKSFGLIWDIAHTDRAYGDSWKSFYFSDYIAPYIRHVHIKDVNREKNQLTLPGDGDIPIASIVKQLLCDGYREYFSLEWEKKWHPELPDIETALKCFINIMMNI